VMRGGTRHGCREARCCALLGGCPPVLPKRKTRGAPRGERGIQRARPARRNGQGLGPARRIGRRIGSRGFS
jgi:hypothetical protein